MLGYFLDFKKISETEVIFGITLDLILHFIIGAFITVILRKYKKYSYKKIILFLFGIELTKEILDSQTMTWTLLSSVFDMIATFIYPITSYLIYKFKQLYESRD